MIHKLTFSFLGVPVAVQWMDTWAFRSFRGQRLNKVLPDTLWQGFQKVRHVGREP